MGYADQYDLSASVAFRKKVEQAVVTSAKSVAAEARETPPSEQQVRRAKLANAILVDPTGWASKFAAGVASNPAINAESPDDAVLFTTNSLFDAYAGVV